MSGQLIGEIFVVRRAIPQEELDQQPSQFFVFRGGPNGISIEAHQEPFVIPIGNMSGNGGVGLGLSLDNRIAGGKVLRCGTKRVENRAALHDWRKYPYVPHEHFVPFE